MKWVVKIYSYPKAQTLFLLSTALIPIQLNKYFFTKSSLVLGIPIDYLAISIYLFDICALPLFILFFIENKNNLSKFYTRHKTLINILVIFNIYQILSSFSSSMEFTIPLFFNLKTVEFSLFFIVAVFFLSQKRTFSAFLKIVTVSLSWQSVLVFFEFFLKRSVGLTFLGERLFSTTTSQIAHVNIPTGQYLRPYGTFPHPNVLGAFFIIYLLFLLSRANQKKIRFQTIKLLAILASSASTVLTFSKTSIFLLGATIAVNLPKNGKIFLVPAFILMAVMYLIFFSENSINSIAERVTLFEASFEVIAQNPMFGVGSNNFIKAMSTQNIMSTSLVRLLQPVHNVFLLILAENGVIGLLLFLLLLFQVFKFVKTPKTLILFTALIIYLTVDHFLWTLEQGRLLFWLSLAFITSSQSRRPSWYI